MQINNIIKYTRSRSKFAHNTIYENLTVIFAELKEKNQKYIYLNILNYKYSLIITPNDLIKYSAKANNIRLEFEIRCSECMNCINTTAKSFNLLKKYTCNKCGTVESDLLNNTNSLYIKIYIL